ncbi:MAG: hypothetical protein HN729_08250 [Candidatus Marinimicrobia bacterium]|jgi:ectoine hydroxylase-related dioxygenase (phytanoyl-CoA dioxygenase family)|nr:hypothetical protein [Candidatus Neomarinimicrobiota bacterium]MBT3635131.1 hypothetical protein [Candidatus Neomarinimicrobiota bacterium]MBT3682998.1 hypothetical protein [Candidatus Neomarinimicrobiota bacterium]MBT3759910.1 hypothetical protein [Candidatus Neomarinimicrobiota bacterium]MBT3895637.1 hypothetical protein [Candidatus Neomarinimicrobiota bacterium]
MLPIFLNSRHQKEFDDKGYIILPFVGQHQVAELLSFYHSMVKGPENGPVWDSSRYNNYEENELIRNTIFEALSSGAARYFQNHILYGGTYLVKPRVDSSELPLHQDWNIIEEDKYISAQIWCPLSDVNSHNGSLFVLDKSHNYYETFRSGSIHGVRFHPADNKIISDNIVEVKVKAGHAVVYQNKLFHGSYKNDGRSDRIVALGSVMSQDAQLVYYQKSDDGNSIQKIKASAEFYLKDIDYLTKSQLPPKAKVLETIHQPAQTLSIEDIIAKLNPDQNEASVSNDKNFLQKWLGKFFT